jgi:hypothetical protein
VCLSLKREREQELLYGLDGLLHTSGPPPAVVWELSSFMIAFLAAVSGGWRIPESANSPSHFLALADE